MGEVRIGQVAKRAGVGVETIRFYERKGLLAEPPRRTSGYRQYSEEAILRIRFIRRSKELGFSLREVQELLTLRVDRQTSSSEVKLKAEAKIADIEQKINDLERMKKALANLTACCSGQGSVEECPILEALEGSPGTGGSEPRMKGTAWRPSRPERSA